MRCPECGQEELRKHRHGNGRAVVYGRWAASEERRTTRRLLEQAREREDRDRTTRL